MDKIGHDEPQRMEFQAEVAQMLDIVINSLYTETDIFIRELISNASDALEKLRLIALTEDNITQGNIPLEINIETDDQEKRLIIADTGIGMSREELIENLGTIAHSGSREFMERLAQGERQDTQLIGQFGVGFYSAFMAGSSVTVQSLSYRPDSQGWEWSSDGVGTYSLAPIDGLKRGTRIIISLKEDASEYADAHRIKNIIRQYSNFIPFEIKVNGETVNTVQAIWTRNKSEIKDEEYHEFYKFLTNAYVDPMFRLHISADAPIQLHALLFFPSDNPELYGFGRMEPGVSLYSRKVLIDQKSTELFPEYLRFIKGVVDSEDLPLNISRETTQNSQLIKKMGRFLTKRVLSFLEEQSKDKEKYRDFWNKFSRFIKEGCVNEPESKEQLSKLLRFQSSGAGDGEFISLEEYVGRMKENQTSIYYINGSSREMIEAGPYLEVFRHRDIEVLYLLEPVDDFVMTSLQEFQGKKLVSADQADLGLPPSDDDIKDTEDSLTPEEVSSLVSWMKEMLPDGISEVRESQRLRYSPAMVVNPDAMLTTTMQRVLTAAESQVGNIGPKVLEINPNHGVMVKLARLKDGETDRDFLKSCVEQIADNAFLAAGLTGKESQMIERVYKIMERALEAESENKNL